MKFSIHPFLIICVLTITSVYAQDGDYCQVKCDSGSHTACPNGQNKCDVTCKESNDGYVPMDDDQRLEILDTHNKLREKVASGAEQQGELKDVKASNMEILSWSYEAEYIAACLAKRCIFQHDDCRDLLNGTYCGQNLAYEGSSDPNARKAWVKPNGFNGMIQSWYGEVKDCKGSYYDSFPSEEQQSDKAIGHFTQIIWAVTNRVGCAYFIFNSDGTTKVHLVCNYWPGGNIIATSIFKRGESGPDCGKDSRYPHLCGVQLPLRGNSIFSHLQAIVLINMMYFSNLSIFLMYYII